MKILVLLSLISLWFEPINGQTKNWTLADDYFPVFTFTENVMGLTVELDYDRSIANEIINSAFTSVPSNDSLEFVMYQQVNSCKAIDTTGRFRFFRNITFENLLLTGVNKTFIVYCTKGFVERTITDAVFSLSECKSNIVVFRFDKIDVSKYGHPIFCSRKKIPLSFGKFPEIDKEIARSQEAQQYDYSDSIKPVSFAHSDSLYFAYSDDFNWNLGKVLDNYFPGRAIYVKRADRKLYPKWALNLDLFGTPCD